MRSFFITGTDTGVGKTLLTCGLGLVLKERGIRFSVWKPIETGCLPRAEDSEIYRKLLGESFREPEYSFSQPVAPWVASEMERKKISPTRLVRKYFEYSSGKEVLLVEGAGGMMVPIQRDFYMMDLAYLLKLPLIVVARNCLGVLNHSLLSLQYAKTLGLHVSFFVLSSLSKEITEPAQKSNGEVIRDLIFPVRMLELPWLEDWKSSLSVFRTIWDALDSESSDSDISIISENL